MNGSLSTRSQLAALLAALLTVGIIATPATAQAALPLTTLEPGVEVVHTPEITINLVFIGGGEVDHAEVVSALPTSYLPVNRSAQFLEIESRPLGLDYQFEYQFIEASEQLTDRFFRFLDRAGELASRTEAQQAYNDQEHNRLEVTEEVLHIDARQVENWLNSQGRAALRLAPDTYTVFFLDWYGREDFQFHVYTVDDLDPDSGQPMASREVNGWGGAGRSWFYDLSAGPVFLGGGWNVDDEDLIGNGVIDYRVPPSWEYHLDGFRDPAQLGNDLGMLVRYGAINPLFTPSPIYDPMVTVPAPGGAKVLSVHVFQALPGGDAIDRIDPDAIRRTFTALQPYHDWQVQLIGSDPIDAGVQHTLDIFISSLQQQPLPADPGCWEPFEYPVAQLFCFFDAYRDQYFPVVTAPDYQAPAAIFELPREDMVFPGGRGIIGFADRDWNDPDGTQLFSFALSSPTSLPPLGVSGYTVLATHEYGHHFGLVHPYDGWDSETEQVYFAADGLLFATAAAQVHSIMATGGPVDLRAPLTFSQFERDNLARWESIGHLNWTNLLLEQVLDHPRAHQVRGLIIAADRQAALALRQFEAWRYDQAAAAAIRSYGQLVTAAQRLGIDPAATR